MKPSKTPKPIKSPQPDPNQVAKSVLDQALANVEKANPAMKAKPSRKKPSDL